MSEEKCNEVAFEDMSISHEDLDVFEHLCNESHIQILDKELRDALEKRKIIEVDGEDWCHRTNRTAKVYKNLKRIFEGE